ncbi:MAG: hypothetical protein NC827_01890 [Candidatus Omnitrophica bacterium]|nr:hypothetical protein [Candidatus Omnitrophota bacterium]
MKYKAIIGGVFLCILLCFFEIFTLLIIDGSPFASDFSTGGALFLTFIFILLFGKFFSIQEKSIIYLMILISCSIVSWGFVLNLIGFIAGIYYFSTPTNEWDKFIHPNLPKFLFIRDYETLRYFYEGLPEGIGIPYKLWFSLLFKWFLFIVGFYFLSIFLFSIFRKQWIEKEKLLFPLTELPSRLISENNFIKDRLMWAGFFIPFFIYSLRGISLIFPSFPKVNLYGSISAFRGQFGFPLNLHFEVIGLSFLMPKDVLLSVWLFAFIYIILTGFFKLTGYTIGYTIPYTDPAPQQLAFFSFGALIIYAVSSFFNARSYLKDIFLHSIKKKDNIDDKEEVIPYRVAFWGFIISFIYMVFWMNLFGLNLLISFYFVIIIILIFFATTKIIAQTGLAYYRAPMIPFGATLYTFGYNHIGEKGIVGLATSFIWAGDIRTTVMSSYANGVKVCSNSIKNLRLTFIPTLISIFISFVFSCFVIIYFSYKYGAANLSSWHLKRLSDFVLSYTKSEMQRQVGFGKQQFLYTFSGAIIMIFLMFLKNRFLWWPISPVGLAIGLPLPVFFNWFPIFIAWVLKTLIMKYGGVKIYNRAKVFFLGMVLGSFFISGIWNFIAFLAKVQGIKFTIR